tara:strand:- start:1270 stop:2370 length:1101 start_codon:yes stop_codon:yes gene_type:complete
MADKKISALTSLTNPDLTLDFIPITDGTSETKKINLTDLGLPLKSFNTIALAGGNTAFIGGDQAGNTRGINSLDIQSKRDFVGQVAQGELSLVVGANSTVTGNKAYSFGRSNTVKASNSIALGENVKIQDTAGSSVVAGRICDISGVESVVYGSSINIASDSTNNVIVGKTIVADQNADSSVGVGSAINIQGSQSTALGYNLDVLQDNSAAIGRNVRVNAVGVVEIGGWDSAGNRDGAIRCSEQGVISSSVNNVAYAPLDGGATAGDENATTLPREMIAIRRDGDEVLADVNIAGTVKTVSFGDATRLGAGDNTSARTSLGGAIRNLRSDTSPIKTISHLTQAAYNILVNSSPSAVDANTLYIIKD